MKLYPKISVKILFLIAILLTITSLSSKTNGRHTLYSSYKTDCQYDPFRLYDEEDSTKVDFSTAYKNWLTPDSTENIKDFTHKLIEDKYTFQTTLFSSKVYIIEDETDSSLNYWDTIPSNGILGKNYTQIEMYIDPQIEQKDSLIFQIHGKSKVKNIICDFAGEIHIEHIYGYWNYGLNFPKEYRIVGSYFLNENKKQYGSGTFQGTYSSYCYIDEKQKTVLLYDLFYIADGYENRNFVGTWTNHKTKEKKKCIWGDNRLPYTFDFDIGDGSMVINPKYNSIEWEQWKSDIPSKQWWKNTN